MFWALISPLRHTSEPPRFGPTHPIRLAFERHGATVARNPTIYIVLAVTISVILSFPSAFLYFNASPGPSSVTHHVWTSATPYNAPGAVPDMGIRQAWIQGSYMEALTLPVLNEGLRIQQALLGPDMKHVPVSEASYTNGPLQQDPPVLEGGEEFLSSALVSPGSFFHSPLLYWNCSLRVLGNDPDILQTVNDRASKHSASRIGLRWGSVFAGKHISHQRLVAADALVISLFYHLNSSAGAVWDLRAAQLAKEARSHGRFRIYPGDGKERASTLYEFRYEPMTTREKVFLTGCYLCVAVYLAVLLRRLRAVKSRLGLVFTVLTQLCTSIMSSFTILAVFKVSVTHIPSWIFPFVVIVIGLESMFRLINAVLATPAEHPTTARISTALGEVGFISFVAVVTNLGVLIVIQSVSVPAIGEFCAFACVALLVDYALHMTFFLAVLSVDVRRMELQDSLDRMNFQSNEDDTVLGEAKKKPNGGFDLLFKGGSPLSTRIAGSAIMICFAVALNMHFLDNQHPLVTLAVIGNMLKNPHTIGQCSLSQMTEMPLNVARSPTAWMRLQDQLTGMELIRAIKPGDVRVIARAFNPLFFVIAHSDRARIPGKMPSILSTLELDIIRDHMQAFVLSVVLVVAGVTMFMNHLLLHDIPMDDITEGMYDARKGEGMAVTCQTLIEGHSLDVVILAVSPKGFLVSVGLDQRVNVWTLQNRQRPIKTKIEPTCKEHILWPVMAIALDGPGDWLAIAPRSGKVSIYCVRTGNFYQTLNIDLKGQAPAAFFFAPLRKGDRQVADTLIVLCNDGMLSEVYIRTGEIFRHRICNNIIVSSSHAVFASGLPLRIVTACQRGRIFITAKLTGSGEWYTEQLDLMAPPLTSPILEPGEPCTILPLSALGMVVSSRSCNVELVDPLSGSIIRSFQTGQFKPSTLRAFHAQRKTCLYCGCPSVKSFSIAYNERESGMFMMHTFTSSRGKMRDICLRAERDRRERKCTGFESVSENTHWLENVAAWEPTNVDLVVGIRRREVAQEEPSSDDFESVCGRSRLRRRRRYERKIQADDEDEWEAWTMDSNGAVETHPLQDPGDTGCDSRLVVGDAGPVIRVGGQSVAFGFSNTIKVLYLGDERFQDEECGDPYRAFRRNHRMHRR